MEKSSRSNPPLSHPQAPLSIVIIVSEAAPFAKTGGLADVAGALPLALGRLGHRVDVVLPRYRSVDLPAQSITPFAITLGGRRTEAGFIEHAIGERVRAVFVDCPELYDRDGLYGIGSDDYPDNPRRFAFLAQAALEFCARSGERPSLLHGHDWQAGLVPVYLKTVYREHPVIAGLPSVFTIHNLAYQGVFPPEWMSVIDLDAGLFTVDALEYWGKISFLKGGITFSEIVTTVSRRYAKEILTPEFGFGFEGILRRRQGSLYGIPNGIDVEEWDPERDPYLAAPFSATNLAGKLENKRAVLAAFRLPAEGKGLNRPLIGMVSRLVDQKGFDLVAAVGHELPRLGASFIVLGTGEPSYQMFWSDLATKYPDRIAAHFDFDERLSHLIEAGADMFLMPSRFEPCGLNQMYSMRYGTVPIVRATGGLDDTVRNYNERTGQGTGFKFEEYSPTALLRALKRAIRVFTTNKEAWRTLQLAGMREDFSWDRSAREYVKVYRKAVAAAPRRQRLAQAANSMRNAEGGIRN